MMCSSKPNTFSSALHWYQKKLGSYDQQQWEKTIEEKVLRGLSDAIPKKVARVKTELIDLDLIRGSAFSKAKPKQGWIATTLLGFVRVLFFPFYLRWWTDQTNSVICTLLLFLYTAQITSIYIYFNPHPHDLISSLLFLGDDDLDATTTATSQESNIIKELDEIPPSEVLVPVIMFIIISVIQSHIAASYSLDERSRSRIQRDCSPSGSSSVGAGRSGVVTGGGSSVRTSATRIKRKKRSPEKKASRKKETSPLSPQKSNNNKSSETEPDKENQHGESGNNANIVINSGRRTSKSKKPSDEESGLELHEVPEVKQGGLSRNTSSSTSSFTRQQLPVTVELSDCNTSAKGSPSHVSSITDNKNPAIDDQLTTGWDGDHDGELDACDASSLDELSPYSTVNSASNANWRRYSDIISQRIRSLSHSACTSKRRHSGTDESLRNRSNTFSKCRTRFSPGVRTHPADRPDQHNNSSNDSEASLSPTTPNKTNTDLDWPMINSEGTSEEEDEEDVGRLDLGQSRVVGDYHTSGIFREGDILSDDWDCDMDPHIISFGADTTRKRTEYVSCSIWRENECQKVDLSVLDISSAVIRKAGKARHSNEYLYLAFFVALVLACIPGLFRLQQDNKTNLTQSTTPVFGPKNALTDSKLKESVSITNHNGTDVDRDVDSSMEMFEILLQQLPVPEPSLILESFIACSCSLLVQFVIIVSLIERYCLSVFFFFLLCVAERTYKERFMFAKYFCHLTSARRARRSDLPHFRLNKVRNIKTWLSVRSYLKKHGPQRSVDIICSISFILAVCILTFLCIQLLRENDTCSSRLYCWEMVSWNLAIGIYIMRLMVLGLKMNSKYKSNLSVLITEQINLYLQLEQKPHKKEELSLANNVLKLANDLLRQLEAPFKISGFSANHYLYNITKVVVLSAFSAVISEILGFKLKLHKIKL